MQEFLAFVDRIGEDNDKVIYRFDFTTNIDVVWGTNFNEAPALNVNVLTPDENSLSSRAKAAFPREMETVRMSSCFSIQDCIDGIVAMIFSDIDDDTLELDGKPFFLNFGEPLDDVKEKLEKAGVELYDFEVINSGDSSAIDEIIDGGIITDDDIEDDGYDF